MHASYDNMHPCIICTVVNILSHSRLLIMLSSHATWARHSTIVSLSAPAGRDLIDASCSHRECRDCTADLGGRWHSPAAHSKQNGMSSYDSICSALSNAKLTYSQNHAAVVVDSLPGVVTRCCHVNAVQVDYTSTSPLPSLVGSILQQSVQIASIR